MRCLFIALLTALLIPSVALTQEWKPFSKDRDYFWAKHNTTVLASIVVSETSDFLFNSELCEDWFPENMWSFYRWQPLILNRDKPAYFHQFDDRVLIGDYDPEGQQWYEFEIRHKSNPGDSWQTQGYELLCDTVFAMKVLGEPDSVKKIICLTPPMDTFEFWLSKNHGFVRYTPLRYFRDPSLMGWRSYFDFVGMRTDSTTLGFVQPEFEEYFVFQSGDILIWQEIKTVDWIVDTTYLVDLIESVTHIQGVITYKSSRSRYDSHWNYVITEPHELQYSKRFEGTQLECPISWTTHPDSLEHLYHLNSVSKRVNDDNTTQIRARVRNLMQGFDFVLCEWKPRIDGYAYNDYEVGRGMTKLWTANFSGSNTLELDLIGSVIGGKKVGFTDIPVISSSTFPRYVDLKIHPNPASSQLFVRDIDQFESYSIYDQTGHMTQSHGAGMMPIDVTEIAAGTYILEVRINSDTNGVARLVILR